MWQGFSGEKEDGRKRGDMPYDSFWYLGVPSDYLRSLEVWKLQKGLMAEVFVHESELAPILT